MLIAVLTPLVGMQSRGGLWGDSPSLRSLDLQVSKVLLLRAQILVSVFTCCTDKPETQAARENLPVSEAHADQLVSYCSYLKGPGL